MASAPVRKLSRDAQRRRVHARVRTRVVGTPERPRLCVYRSLGHVPAQIIDDRSGRTLVSASSVDEETKKNLKGGGNIASAKAIGKNVAERAKAAGVVEVVSTAAVISITAASRRSRMRRGKRGYSSNLCRSKFCVTVWRYGGSWR